MDKAIKKKYNSLVIQDFDYKLNELLTNLSELRNSLTNFMAFEEKKRKLIPEIEEDYNIKNEVKFPTRQAIKNLMKGPFIDQMDD